MANKSVTLTEEQFLALVARGAAEAPAATAVVTSVSQNRRRAKFDITKVKQSTLEGPATWGQCERLGKMFSPDDYGRRQQIAGYLYHRGRGTTKYGLESRPFTFKMADHAINNRKRFPKKWAAEMDAFVEAKAAAGDTD